jgi:hypothetical protein
LESAALFRRPLWICYTFNDDWHALSVYFYDSDNNDSLALTVIPNGRQDEWLAFLKLLDDLYDSVWRGTRRGYIEMIGGSDELAEVMRKASFDDVVLNAETLEHVAAQRHIFDKEILNHYESLRVPRLRKVLFPRPSGTKWGGFYYEE